MAFFRHPGEGRDPVFFKPLQNIWIPAFAGMTTFYEIVNFGIVSDFDIRICDNNLSWIVKNKTQGYPWI